MNPVEEIKKEHEDIERELLELEEISNGNVINYSNLVHVLTNLYNVWDNHEKKEDKIFPILEKKEKLVIPVKEMLFQHKELKPSKNAIEKAINSGSEFEIRKALNNHVGIIIKKLREHYREEDEVLYTLALNEIDEEDIKVMEIALR